MLLVLLAQSYTIPVVDIQFIVYYIRGGCGGGGGAANQTAFMGDYGCFLVSGWLRVSSMLQTLREENQLLVNDWLFLS